MSRRWFANAKRFFLSRKPAIPAAERKRPGRRWFPRVELLEARELLSGTVTGNVFEDFNANGRFDTAATVANDGTGSVGVAIDQRLAGVTVTAYDAAGNAVASTTTTATGPYTLTTPGNGPYRVQFSTLPAGYSPGPQGPDSGTTVQFTDATGSGTLGLGLTRPGDFSPNNPVLVSEIYYFGDQVNGPNKDQPVLVSFPYSAGTQDSDTTLADYRKNNAGNALSVPANQVGSVWGLAYSPQAQKIYAAAFMKKHVGFGPGGTGAIYVMNTTGSTASVYVDLNQLFGANTAGANPHDTSGAASPDGYFLDNGNQSYDAVGKVAIGGIAVSDDGKHLYAMDLANRTLYDIPLDQTPTAANIRSVAVPLATVPNVTGAGGDDVRPFAVEFHQGKIYVGLVNSAQTTDRAADLRAYVYTVDPATLTFSSQPVLEFSLNFPRGQGYVGETPAAWNPWTTAWTQLPNSANQYHEAYPEPMLTGIAFDATGNMVLGFRDRYGDQTGNYINDNPASPTDFNYRAQGAGDTLRAFINTPGDLTSGWTLENDGGGPSGQGGTTTQKDGQGPGGGEFYYQDNLPGSHDEVSSGGVLQLAGFPDVAVTSSDPSRSVSDVRSGGVRWFNDTTGQNDKAFEMYPGTPAGNDTTTLGKANGVGNLIALAPPGPVEIGNRVFLDTNGNGIQDPGEMGIQGVTVDLFAPGGTSPLATAVTDGNGDYYFSSAPGTSTASTSYGVGGLLPDTAGYTVRLDNAADYAAGGKLAGLTPSPANVGSDPAIDSNGVLVNGTVQAAVTTGDPGTADHTIDFGFYQPVTVGNFVWDDSNGNGVQDGGEPGIQGVTLTLTGTSGSGASVTDHVTTDGTGHYLFTEAPGTYTVAVDAGNFTGSGALVGYTATPTQQGSDRAVDSNPSPSGTTPGALPSGGSDTSVDFGYYKAVTVGDFVWQDTNGNGIQDSGEPGIQGVTLTLTGTAGSGASVTDHATTDGTGHYLFTEAPGTYTVTVDAANFTSGGALMGCSATPTVQGSDRTVDSNPSPSGTNPVALPSGSGDLTVDFGYYRPVTVGDFVWEDTNANGIQDGGEPGIQGVTLTLTGTTGAGASVTDRATTDSSGHYLFTEAPGTYTVAADASNFASGGALVGYAASPTLQGSDRTVDSNPSPSGTTPGALPSGGSDPTVDFGYYQAVAVGDFVWDDSNGNGVQDSGEPGIQGVTLTLTGTASGGASVTDHATTDGTGHYLFTETPGAYTVTVDAANFAAGGALAGYTAAPTLQGSDRTVDSNPNSSATSPATLPSGGTDTSVDFGYYKAVTVGDFVWQDSNGNGIQDGGEPGIQGVTLTLTGTSGGASVTDHATTDGTGHYLFTEAPGTYTVTVDAANFAPGGALAGYTATPTLQGSDRTVDSNPSPSGTTPGALPSGGSDTSVDFGYYQAVTVGDFVWQDTNGNGIQDAGEPGIQGVTVTLTGTAGGGASVTDHATTDGSGHYLFTQAPGAYTVTVDASNFAAGGALAGYAASPTLQGSDRTVDSNPNSSATSPATLPSGGTDTSVDFGYYKAVSIGDFVWQDSNGNGVQDGGEPGIQGVTLTLTGSSGNGASVTDHATTDGTGHYLFTETPGAYTVTVDAANFAARGALTGYSAAPTLQGNDRTVDSNPSPSGTTPGSLPSGSTDTSLDFGYFKPVAIGDFVWEDTNGNGVQDAGEPGIQGVTLTLTGTSGSGASVTDHATTDGTGHYLFTEAPGTYTVAVDAANLAAGGALAGYTATPTLQGSDRTVDSNPSPSGTSPAALSSGSGDLTADFGYYRPVAVGDFVWDDTNANGVQDPGEPGIQGVTLTLTGTSGSGASVTDHATTDNAGHYLFTEAPGTYTVRVDAANFASGGTLAGYTASPTLQGSSRAIDSNPSPSGTGPATLASGGSDRTVDFGEVAQPAPAPANAPGSPPPASISGIVYFDLNGNHRRDRRERLAPGMLVILEGTDDRGQVVRLVQRTATDGSFLFANLRPGTYTVTVQSPQGYVGDPGTTVALDGAASLKAGYFGLRRSRASKRRFLASTVRSLFGMG